LMDALNAEENANININTNAQVAPNNNNILKIRKTTTSKLQQQYTYKAEKGVDRSVPIELDYARSSS
ncbi:3525_t:CDS:2, partial [Racocetra fulgida]